MAFDLGDAVPLAFDVLDSAGDPANADTVTLTITLPDGTNENPSVVNPPAVTGRYQLDYLPTTPGRHLVRWTATSPPAAYTDQFDVRPADPPLIVSLADVKRYLGKSVEDTTDDEELREFVEAATSLVEDIRGEAVVRRTVVEDIRVPFGTREVLLSKSPVISLTSVASVDGSVTWDVADLHVRSFGIVSTEYGVSFSGLVRFTYVAGREVIPANFALAAKMIVGHLWETQQQQGISPRAFGADQDDVMASGLGYAIPNRALELLGGKRGPQVA